jgi:cysteine-rich repeat protein
VSRAALACLALLGVSIAAGCGDDGEPSATTSTDAGGAGGAGGGTSSGGGGTGGGYDGPCTALELGDTALYFESVATIGLQAPVLPPVEDLAKTRLTLELYEDDGSGALPPLAAGSFPFAAPPDDNYGTCQHCVLLVAFDLGGAPKRAFYPASGVMELEQVPVDFEPVIVGRAREMEIVEVTQNEDFTWEVLPGGDCFYVDEWAFDTRPVDGGACESAEECPNEATQVCEPDTGTCGPYQCSLTFDPPFCDQGEVCLSQLFDPDQNVSGAAVGACYRECDPASAAGCDAGQICRPLGPTQAFGVCVATGAAAIGESCTPRDISTECVAGAVCTGEPGECARICGFLTPKAGCDAGRYCALSNLCELPGTGDDAAIGELCDPSSPELVECGIEGDAFRGLCMKFFFEDPALTCERLCRTGDPACPAGEICLGIFSNPVVGVCHPKPVCGDGVVDVVGGEVCDDGNTASGDGCGDDCLTPELDVLCGAAAPLVLDEVVSGTTIGGPTGYTSQCDPYIATPVATYSYLPPSAGRLRLSLTSGADLGLSVYADCADPVSELECQNLLGDDVVDVDFAVAPAAPVLVIVRGASPLQSGAFGLVGTFTPAVCGDGEAVGPEACDDGNTQSGDGCSADCMTIEWAAVCAALPALSVTQPNAGTTDGAPGYFDAAGQCSFVNGGGAERAYAFTAPSNGTLHLELTQPSDNFSLYVQDGCGPIDPGTYVACSNFAQVGEVESTSPSLAAGQTVTVIVDGFTTADEGPYVLTATFEPG